MIFSVETIARQATDHIAARRRAATRWRAVRVACEGKRPAPVDPAAADPDAENRDAENRDAKNRDDHPLGRHLVRS